MKRIFCLLLTVIISAGVTGCAETPAAGINDSEGVVPVESIEIVVGDDEGAASVVENTTTEIPIETTMTAVETTIAAQTQEISEADIPSGNGADIGMTDEEIYELGMKRADELHKLYMDFLHYPLDTVSFSYDFKNYVIGKYETISGYIYDHYGFTIINHETIKTYSDLFSLFCKTCTLEYSTYLLKHASYQFAEIDGQLGFAMNGVEVPMADRSSKGYMLNSFNITAENEIELKFSLQIDILFGEPEPYEDGRFIDYSIFLKNIDGEWLISDCTNISRHGN